MDYTVERCRPLASLGVRPCPKRFIFFVQHLTERLKQRSVTNPESALPCFEEPDSPYNRGLVATDLKLIDG
jgi:hypothetical protein